MTKSIKKALEHLSNQTEWCIEPERLSGVTVDRVRQREIIDHTLKELEAIMSEQIEEIIKKPHILPKNAQHQESAKQGINFYHRQMRKRVDKLKESSNA